LKQESVLLTVDHSYEDAQRYLQAHKESNKGYWDSYVAKIEERLNLSGLLSINSNIPTKQLILYLNEKHQNVIVIKDLVSELLATATYNDDDR
jgi:hypothetical protein